MYNFDEGAFELAPEWSDGTVHLFERQVGHVKMAMAVTREKVAAEVTLAIASDAFLDLMTTRLRRFELIEKVEDRRFGVPGVRLHYKFFHPDFGQANHLQLMLRLEDRVLSIALTSPAMAEQAQIQEFEAVLKSLKLRRKTS